VKYKGEYPLLGVEEVGDGVLALGGDGCFITLWNWKHNEKFCRVFGHPGSVMSLSSYHPFLVSSGGDSKIKIWEVRENNFEPE
jgi:WD40 repeat protein